MKTSDALKVIAGLVIGVAAWKAYKAATGAMSSTLDTLASLPGRIADAAAEFVVAGTTTQPDTPSPANSGPFVPKVKRDVSPLVKYFEDQGTGSFQIDSARRHGWTESEIQAAVDTVASFPFGWS